RRHTRSTRDWSSDVCSSDLAIRAPIPGRTGRLLLRAGNLVRANSADPLVVINQIHPILVRFAVPQQSLGDLQRYRKNRLPVLVKIGRASCRERVEVTAHAET